jgi:transcriptional regulator with XRE-family HTH domain
MDFGKRLREERERLRLSQPAFAELGGVKRVSQHLYEHGERFPDVQYLENLKQHGVDVLYLVFGRRSVGIEEGDRLEFSAQLLFDIYRVVDEFARDEYGELLPFEARFKLFQFLCAALSGSTERHDSAELRARLARLSATG